MDKLRKESQSLVDKVFNRHANKKGHVSAEIVPNLMKELQPDVEINQDDLMNMVGANDKTGSGTLDLEGFNKVALHFLLRQARHDQDQFIHKHEIGDTDFPPSE